MNTINRIDFVMETLFVFCEEGPQFLLNSRFRSYVCVFLKC